MKNVFRFLIIFLAIIVLEAYGEQVTIPDTNLAAVVRDALGLNPSDPIPKKKLEKLETLYAARKDIGDLTGLEKATGLKTLIIRGDHDQKKITDITPLAGLTQLTKLSLSENRIKDIKPLAKLTQLKDLKLNNNELIHDITPLSKLKHLIHLSLYNNRIRDITPLAELTRLKSLRIFMNEIRDITPLANLTQLIHLDISINYISDITPLTGLTQLTDLRLQANQISDITPLAYLTQLTDLDIAQNEISDILPIAHLKQLTRVSLSENLINEQDIVLLYRTLFGRIPATKYFPHSLGRSWVYEDQAGNEVIRRAIEGEVINGKLYHALSYEPELEDQTAYSPFIYSTSFTVSNAGVTLPAGNAVKKSIKARLDKEMLYLATVSGVLNPKYDINVIGKIGKDHLLLLPDTLVIDKTWKVNEIKVSVRVRDVANEGTMNFIITETGKVLDTETIETPAGTFKDCFKVKYWTHTETPGLPLHLEAAAPGETETTIWFAPNIGIVKYHQKSAPIFLKMLPADESGLDIAELSMERTLQLKEYEIK